MMTFAVLVFITTLVDVCTEKEREISGVQFVVTELFEGFLLAFSAVSNVPEILSLVCKEGQIRSLHCLRVLSIVWVVSGHTLDVITGVVGWALKSGADTFQSIRVS